MTNTASRANIEPPPLEAGIHIVTRVSQRFNVDVLHLRRFFDDHGFENYLESTSRVFKPKALVPIIGEFPEQGSIHQVVLENQHTAYEAVVDARYPDFFRYQLYNITEPGAKVIKYGLGEFSFTALEGGRSLFTWSYQLRPKSILIYPLLNLLLKRHFRAFMQRGLDNFSLAVNEQLTISSA